MRSVPMGVLGSLAVWFRGVVGSGVPSLETFGLELAQLGLLGRSFRPEEYAEALEKRLGVRIVIEVFPDVRLVTVRHEILLEGTLAEVFYSDLRGEALILVRESLCLRPWPAYELALYHELSHLAAGHTRRFHRPERTGSNGTRTEIAWESEAKKRARWLVLAGDYPEVFEAVGADRLS